MDMEWTRRAISVLLILQGITMSLFLQRVAADDFLSPFLSPVFNGICNQVECGKGNCSASPSMMFGFACDCDAGWTQLHVGDSLRFLPCVIPNCTMNYSCSNSSILPSPAPSPAADNFSFFEPCSWTYCGGGTCLQGSGLDYSCQCQDGFSNLFNNTKFPCLRSCSLGADCDNLGLPISNSSFSSPSSPSSPPSPGDPGKSAAPGLNSCNDLQKLLIVISIIIFQAI